jgi:hypothetical protein
MSSLPMDCWSEIISNVDFFDLQSLSLVSKYLNRVSKHHMKKIESICEKPKKVFLTDPRIIYAESLSSRYLFLVQKNSTFDSYFPTIMFYKVDLLSMTKMFIQKEIVKGDEMPPMLKSLKKNHISTHYLLKNVSIKKLLDTVNLDSTLKC